MLTIRSTLPYIRLYLGMLEKMGSIPYQWPKDSALPVISTSVRQRAWYNRSLLIHGTYAAVTSVNYLLTLDKLVMEEKMFGLLFTLCCDIAFLARLSFVFREQGFIDVISSFYNFERDNQADTEAGSHSVAKFIQILCLFSVFALTCLVGAMLWIKPCMAPFLGYLLLGLGGRCLAIRPLWLMPHLRLLMGVLDVIIFFYLIASSFFVMFSCCFLCMQSLERYLDLAKRSLRRDNENLKVSHDFRGFQIYRQVQLLGIIGNEAYQMMGIPAILASGWAATMLNLYVSVKLHRKIPMPGFAFFPLGLLNGLGFLFVATVAAGVLVQSEKCLAVARNNLGLKKRFLYKRMVRSMGRVMVRFGSSNFVDAQTPFNLTNHALSNSVNLMLLSE